MIRSNPIQKAIFRVMEGEGGAVVVVLGSAQDGGLPQLGSFHQQDLRAMKEGQMQRMGASVAVISGNGRCLLIDASPDLRHQYYRILMTIPEYYVPRQMDPELPIFDAIVLTHAHMGHYLGELSSGLPHSISSSLGLALLGKESANTQQVPTYTTHSMGRFLRENAPWNQLIQLQNISIQEVESLPYSKAQRFSLWEGLELRLFTVPHRAEFTGESVRGRIVVL